MRLLFSCAQCLAADQCVQELRPGGFLTAVDEVVLPYSLPKNSYVPIEPSTITNVNGLPRTSRNEPAPMQRNAEITISWEYDDQNEEADRADDQTADPTPTDGVIKSLAQYAEEEASALELVHQLPTEADKEGDGEADASNAMSTANGNGRPRRAAAAVVKRTRRRAAPRKKRSRTGSSSGLSADEMQPAPKRRATKRTKTNVLSTPKSDRVLRPRRGKSMDVVELTADEDE
jgi:xeroderma pigmentosum group C-complementing protein